MTAVCRSSLVCALLVVAAIDAGGVALAQKPSQAQINAMRQSCRSDYMAHCSTVPTGGAPALNCLKQNFSNLSPACQSAVKAIASDTAVAAASSTPTAPAAPASSAPPSTPAAPAVAAPPATGQPTSAGTSKPSQVQLRNVRQACGADYRTHCGGIPPGGSASIACLKRNARTLSGACQQALGAGAGVTSAAAPTLPPPPPEPAPLLVTPREELFMLRTACGADYAAFCRGLRPGAGRIAACLHYNSASLSPRCQQALVALREGR
jgi:hypothetical protein